jgi:hypothetical protein
MSNHPDPKKYQAIGAKLPGKPYLSRSVADLKVRELKVYCCLLLDRIRQLEEGVRSLQDASVKGHRALTAETILALSRVNRERTERSNNRRGKEK